MTVTPFDVYRNYIAIKLHFTTEKYDYFKFRGRCSVTQASLDKRTDKSYFYGFAKNKNYKYIILANILHRDLWIGEIVHNEESEKIYKSWLRTIQSLSYTFSQDLKHIENLNAALVCEVRQHPRLLRLYLGGHITLETITIICKLTGCYKTWDVMLKNDIVWSKHRLRIIKYFPFLSFDEKKFRKLILDRFSA